MGAGLVCSFHMKLCCVDSLSLEEFPDCYCPVDDSLHRLSKIAPISLLASTLLLTKEPDTATSSLSRVLLVFCVDGVFALGC